MAGKSMHGFLNDSRRSSGPGRLRLNLNFGYRTRRQPLLASALMVANSAVAPVFMFPSDVTSPIFPMLVDQPPAQAGGNAFFVFIRFFVAFLTAIF